MKKSKSANGKKTENLNLPIPVDVKLIHPPSLMMRTEIDPASINDLKSSIAAHGLLQPITIKKTGHSFEIIAGHRRYLAAKSLGWKTIQSYVIDTNPLTAEIIKAHENMMRQDTDPIAEANFFRAIIKKHHITSKRLAGMINRSEAHVSQRLAVLTYPTILMDAVRNGAIAVSAARELMNIRNEQTRESWIRAAIESGINPARAAQWREAANSYHAATPAQADAALEARNADPGTEPSLPCAVCGTLDKISAQTILRVCEKDAKKIAKLTT